MYMRGILARRLSQSTLMFIFVIQYLHYFPEDLLIGDALIRDEPSELSMSCRKTLVNSVKKHLLDCVRVI